jgi:hypothetical protein
MLSQEILAAKQGIWRISAIAHIHRKLLSTPNSIVRKG